MDPSPLTITQIGPFAVSVRGQPMRRLRSRSVHWLLAMLAMRNGRSVSHNFRAKGNRDNVVLALLGQGQVAEKQSEIERAKELFAEGLLLAQEGQSLLMASGELEGLSRVAAAGVRDAAGGITEQAARLMGVAAVREALGEADFADGPGRGLSWTQAAALALNAR